MSRIKKLSIQVANQIAAGEVIDKPKQVVKELLENSLDANATEIQVKIEGAGLKYISVTDNGTGIHPDDLSLSFMAHATSKINSYADLIAVKTLGFRGEALASIGSVSKMTITSKVKSEQHAYQVIVNEQNDHAAEINIAAHQEGTTIEVKDLFYNTPVRKNYLASLKTESEHILSALKSFVLSHKHIRFSYSIEGKKTVFPAAFEPQKIKLRVSKVMGGQFLQNSTYFESVMHPLKLTGWLSFPTYSRASNDLQYIFINNRAVKDRLIIHTIKQCYFSQIETGRYAAFILYFEIPYDLLDVNIHPTKQEVRFKDSRLVHDFLARSIAKALQQISKTVTLPTSSEKNFENRFEKNLQQSKKENSIRNAGVDNVSNKIKNIKLDIKNNSLKNIEFDLKANVEKKLTSKNSFIALVKNTHLIINVAEGILVAQVVNMRKQQILEMFNKIVNEKLTVPVELLQQKPLMIPKTLNIPLQHSKQLNEIIKQLKQLGMYIEHMGESSCIIRALPEYLLPFNINILATIFENNDLLKKPANEVVATVAAKSFVEANQLPYKESLANYIANLWETGKLNNSKYNRMWQFVKI